MNPGPDRRGVHPWADIFVAHGDGTFSCGPCLPDDIDPADAAVEVWEIDSHGWTAPIVCARCKRSIPVYVDAETA